MKRTHIGAILAGTILFSFLSCEADINEEIIASYFFGEEMEKEDEDNILIKRNEVPTEGLIAYYGFDEDCKDSSGHNNDATSIGYVQYCKGRFGESKGAIRFRNTTISAVTAPHSEDFQHKNFTINAWVRTDSDYGGGIIVSKGYPTWGGSFYLSVNLCAFRTDDDNYVGTYMYKDQAQLPPTNGWQMITGVINNEWIGIYLNGELMKGGYSVESQKYYNQLPLSIGSFYYEGIKDANRRIFDGDIDDVRIYNVSLSDQEILKLYQE